MGRTRTGLRAVLLVLATLMPFLAGAADENPDNQVWQKVRSALFGGRPIDETGSGVIGLDMPARAEDAAVVPLAIRTGLAQTPERFIRKIYLIIDRNPSPLAAVFTLTPDSGRADLETRVRIEEYTHVRAVAELNDGSLHMARRFVKASGGCSAPAGKDQAAAMARLGKMRLRVDGEPARDRPLLAQLMVSHPNNSGLAMDQLTRLYVPAHYVRRIDVTYAGRPVLSAEVDFSISENPNLRFYFAPRGDGELKAQVVDSKDLRFEESVRLRAPAS